MTLRGVIPLIVLSAGCRSLLGIDEAVVAADADVDAVTDAYVVDAFAPVCPWPYTPLYFDPCAASAPVLQPAVVLTGGEYTLITDSGTFDGPAGATGNLDLVTSVVDGVRVVYVSRFELASDSTFQITGTLPVVLASSTSITIDGVLDLSSSTAFVGAGGDSTMCGPSTGGAGLSCASGGSGGGGGGFGGAGGAGGSSSAGAICSGPGTGLAGGAPGSRVFAPTFRGGCAGRKGGAGSTGGEEGEPGSGGGAVNLVARNSITISQLGVVDAGGGGGRPSTGFRSGGGGGGSGGLIVAQAVMINNAGALAANGGGGGGGTSALAVTSLAQRGDDGKRTTSRADGGIGEGTGGAGGSGGASGAGLAGPDGVTGGSSDRGSGGGGGGAGVIQIRGSLVNTGIISPPQIP